MEFFQVTIEAPDGMKVSVTLPAEQVKFFNGETRGDHFVSAAWLAYCDLWVKGGE